MSHFLVYKSAAGSGKTYTLVKEFLGLVLTHNSSNRYRSILAITFTNKAANEMKERVLIYLKKLASNGNDVNYDSKLVHDYAKEFDLTEETIRVRAKAALQSLLHNYSDLKISTIDKFTHKIIRAFSKDLALQPDFNIELDHTRLLKLAINEVIAKAGEDDYISKVLLKALDKQIEEEKSWSLEKKIFNFTKELIKEENIPYLEKIKAISSTSFQTITHFISSERKKYKQIIKEEATKVISLIDQNGLTGTDFYSGIYSFFWRIAEYDFSKLAEPGSNLEKAINPQIDKWSPARVKGSTVSIIEQIKPVIRQSYSIIETQLSSYFYYEILDENSYNLVLINEIYKELSILKKENGILFLSDFNQLISDEIKDQPTPYIYEKIGERYKNIMIDEFQDTSVLQWKNLLPLIDNSLAFGEKNLVVGDAKQAIYRFRGGKVEQFANLPHLIEHDDDALLVEREQALIRNYQEKTLRTNYRSKEEIVNFNNWFFTQLSNYLSPNYQAIYKEVNQHALETNKGGYVAISFLENEEELEKNYLIQTTQKIKNAIQDGFEYKDICVLVRDKKKGGLLADFLVEQNIPVITSESLVIYKDKEVNFILNFLKYIHNSKDTAAQLELVKFLSSNKKLNSVLLSHTIGNNYRKNLDIEALLLQFNTSAKTLSTLDVSIYDLVEHIIRSFGLDKGKPNPFLLTFLEKLIEQTNKQNNLADFLVWWNDNSEKIAISIPENSNSVSIMTIHKSKGLQFPVVICPFANWSFWHKDKPLKWTYLKEPINELTVSVFKLKKQIKYTPYAYLLEEETAINTLDNFNLLYVALTRPESRLYIISDKKTGSTSELITNYLLPICEQHQNYNYQENTLIFGTPEKRKKQKNEQRNLYHLQNMVSTNWRKTIQISETYKKAWEENKDQKQMEYGIVIHQILGQLQHVNELDDILIKLQREGIIKPSQLAIFKKEITQILAIPQVKNWFSLTGITKNEKELINKKGEISRPDKVILTPTKTILIDYKTGEKNNNHVVQLNKYARILTEMGYPSVKKYILYTQYKEVIDLTDC